MMIRMMIVMLDNEEESGRVDEGITSRRVRLHAHFGSQGRADQAANAVGRHTPKVYISRTAAPRPVSRVQLHVHPPGLLQPHWLAFGGGLAIGAAVLAFMFPQLPDSVWVGPATAEDLVRASLVISGLALAFGWVAGTVARRLPRRRTVRGPVGYELQAEVAAPALDAAEQALRDMGATVVWVLGDEPLAEPEAAGRLPYRR
jgi:hypothetical protein